MYLSNQIISFFDSFFQQFSLTKHRLKFLHKYIFLYKMIIPSTRLKISGRHLSKKRSIKFHKCLKNFHLLTRVWNFKRNIPSNIENTNTIKQPQHVTITKIRHQILSAAISHATKIEIFSQYVTVAHEIRKLHHLRSSFIPLYTLVTPATLSPLFSPFVHAILTSISDDKIMNIRIRIRISGL